MKLGEAIEPNVREYKKTQESLALLKILALSSKNIKEGKVKPLDEAFQDLEKRIKRRQQL